MSKKAQMNTVELRSKIISALNNPKYKSRTLSGISKETHLHRAVVVHALISDAKLASTVKVNPFRSRDGRVLVTTKERFLKEATVKDKFIDFFASKRMDIQDAE